MQDWVEKGYFDEDVNGTSYEDAVSSFAKGDGVFFIGGTWLNADLKGDMGDEAGFVLAPGATERETATAASGGFPWGIPAKSKYPDVAAQYIDFVTGPEAAKILLSHGDVPALAAPEGADGQDALTVAAVDAWKRLKDEDAFHPYVDWATPTMNETMTGAIQEALALKISPDEFAQRLQGDYAEFAAKR
jgi:raffinose/stachyose/melibiose transport system substrate-binding protein